MMAAYMVMDDKDLELKTERERIAKDNVQMLPDSDRAPGPQILPESDRAPGPPTPPSSPVPDDYHHDRPDLFGDIEEDDQQARRAQLRACVQREFGVRDLAELQFRLGEVAARPAKAEPTEVKEEDGPFLCFFVGCMDAL